MGAYGLAVDYVPVAPQLSYLEPVLTGNRESSEALIFSPVKSNGRFRKRMSRSTLAGLKSLNPVFP